MTQLNIRKQASPVLRNVSILLYGLPKIGKTTQASKFPASLLLNCEPGGVDLLAGEHDVVDIRSLEDLERMIPNLQQSEYKTLVLDGFTWLVNQSAREYVKRNNVRDRRRAYAEITDVCSRVLGNLLQAGKIVVATGHSRLVDDDSREDGDNDDKVEVRPDINPRLSDSVFGLFSIICYCYPSDGGAKMLTKPHNNKARRIIAGDRSGLLPAIMPLDAQVLMDALKAGAQPAPAEQAEAEPAQAKQKAAA